MEGYLTCGFLFLGALLLVPITLLVRQAAQVRRLQATSEKLAQRVAALEGGTVAPTTPAPTATPPPLPVVTSAAPPPPQLVRPRVSEPARLAIDWEAFMGVKLFAWIGGFVLFLGVIFLVKYSFENNLITPAMRVVLGAVIGIVLVGAGWWTAHRDFRIPGQSLCATGVLVLYADIFGAHAFYGLIALAVAFVLMSAVTVAAFALAVRLDAPVVVVLGLLGGFLTPPLLLRGPDHPALLFGYVGLLNAGVAAVALRKKWDYLLPLAAIGTVLTEFAWVPENDAAGPALGFLIFLGLQAQFLFFAAFRQRQTPVTGWTARAAATVGCASLGFALRLFAFQAPVAAPGNVFGFALLANAGLCLLALGWLGQSARRDWIALAALVLTWIAEGVWQFPNFTAHATLALNWYAGFFVFFAAYPFFAEWKRPSEAKTALPWAIGALSGLLHFWLVYEIVDGAFPGLNNGLLPALFILPYAVGVWFLLRRRGVAPSSGDARLAWQLGAALFFLSLVCAIQFDREWLTLGWAVEGMALLFLFRKVPNPWLRLIGAGLLALAFARLALNPAVFEYHPRTPMRILNWYLYAYGITCFCLFAGARAVSAFRDSEIARALPRMLAVLGTVLLFILVNIEITDYFSIGPTLTFSFEGNFARDMTYSIAWALFAFVLLLVGMRSRTKWVRYAGLALLVATLAKLFLHDFAILGPLYRIGAFIGVALILIVASFVYQRFLRPVQAEER